MRNLEASKSLKETLLNNDMNKKFTVEICSDLDYEEMVADVSFEHRRFAMITQEDGVDNMEIEIFSPKNEIKLKFPLNDFIESLILARKSLIEMQKSPDE